MNTNETNLTDYDVPLTLSYTYVTRQGDALLEHTTTSDSTLLYHEDLAAGLITGSLSWNLAGDSAAHAAESIFATFDVDGEYQYEATVTATPSVGPNTSNPALSLNGPYFASIGNGGVNYLYVSGAYGPLQLTSHGTVAPKNGADLVLQIQANACHIEGCSNQLDSGSLEFELRLTPVPIPASAWLLMSALVGFCLWQQQQRLRGYSEV